MAIFVDDIQTLRTYLRGVVGRAKHHAKGVDQIVLALAGAVIVRKDKAPLKVRSAPKAILGRALTFSTGKTKSYALSYNHRDRCIELKKGSFRGAVLHSFTNETSLAEVMTVFNKL